MSAIDFTHDPSAALHAVLDDLKPTGIAVISDSNTHRFVAELMADVEYEDIVIPAGEEHKTMTTVEQVISRLLHAGATRSWVAVCVGGGVVCDLGGFAAAIYKRGIRHVNVPTTVLSCVDAAIGGKTGVDFDGLKNAVGAFHEPVATIVSDCFFDTLPAEEVRSGYGEILKHALLSGAENFARVVTDQMLQGDMLDLLRRSVAVKTSIVDRDPYEKGPRKALNLGHTMGHAIESLSLSRGSKVTHGKAVAWGLVGALAISRMKLGFPTAPLYQLARYVADYYGAPAVECADYDRLLQLMYADKKNARYGRVAMTLMSDLGKPMVDFEVTDDEIRAGFDLMRDLLHG